MAICGRRHFLLTTCTLQLITTIERQVFDFLGFMWAPILVNFFNIIFVILGFFGAFQYRPKYIVSYCVWNVLWLSWNIFVICFYLNVGMLDKNGDLLNLGTGSFSWWEANGPGCRPIYDVTEPELFRPARPANVTGCILRYETVEILHAATQCVLGLMAIVGGACLSKVFMEEDDSFDFVGGDDFFGHTPLHPIYVTYTALPPHQKHPAHPHGTAGSCSARQGHDSCSSSYRNCGTDSYKNTAAGDTSYKSGGSNRYRVTGGDSYIDNSTTSNKDVGTGSYRANSARINRDGGIDGIGPRLSTDERDTTGRNNRSVAVNSFENSAGDGCEGSATARHGGNSCANTSCALKANCECGGSVFSKAINGNSTSANGNGYGGERSGNTGGRGLENFDRGKIMPSIAIDSSNKNKSSCDSNDFKMVNRTCQANDSSCGRGNSDNIPFVKDRTRSVDSDSNNRKTISGRNTDSSSRRRSRNLRSGEGTEGDSSSFTVVRDEIVDYSDPLDRLERPLSPYYQYDSLEALSPRIPQNFDRVAQKYPRDPEDARQKNFDKFSAENFEEFPPVVYGEPAAKYRGTAKVPGMNFEFDEFGAGNFHKFPDRHHEKSLETCQETPEPVELESLGVNGLPIELLPSAGGFLERENSVSGSSTGRKTERTRKSSGNGKSSSFVGGKGGRSGKHGRSKNSFQVDHIRELRSYHSDPRLAEKLKFREKDDRKNIPNDNPDKRDSRPLSLYAANL